MPERWLYTSLVLFVFALLLVAIPQFPQLLTIAIPGLRDVGTLLFVALHIGTPVLAFIYLKRRERS